MMQDLTEQERMRFAAAMRDKRREARAKATPTQAAPSPESCGKCGASGLKGCEHWLPYQHPTLSEAQRRAVRTVTPYRARAREPFRKH